MPTTNPVPSQEPSDLLFNAGKLDEVVNGTANSFTDRLGVSRRTVAGMNADFDAQLADAESDLNIYRADAAASAAEALGYLQTIRATSYGAYASDPATDPLGNPPTVGDEYFNTTANLLKRWNGTTWQASDINTANLAASSGSSLVGYDGGTVQDVLDGSKSLQDYAALRAYSGRATRIYITGLLVTAKPAGIAGTFQHDQADTTSSDNNATVIVLADSRRFKRDFSGAFNIQWFGAVTGGTTNSRQAIIDAVMYVNSIGGGEIDFPHGDYLISGIHGSYSVPELNSSIQYVSTAVQVQMYFDNLKNIKFKFQGAKLRSDLTTGGNTIVFDGCSDLHFDGLSMEGATVMSGATPLVTGTGGISFWSTTRNSNNITLNGTKIDKHYGSVDFAGDPASAFKVSGVTFTGTTWFGNSYYGLTCRGNGRQVTIEHGISYKQNRGFFIYDTEGVSVNMDVDYIENTGFSCLVKAYTYNTRDMKISMLARNKLNVVTPRLEFQSQHNPALQPTPAYVRDIDVDYREFNCGSVGSGIEFRYYRDSTLTATSGDVLFDNFTISGSSANNLDSLVALTNNSRLCAVDISRFFAANGFGLLDGKGFIGSKKFSYSPVISFGGASAGVTYSVNSGSYYVVGGLCFVNGRITLSALGSSTGSAQITLPIKTQTGTSRNPTVNILLQSGVAGVTGVVFGEAVVPNNNLVSLRMQGSTGTTSLTHANFTNTSDIVFSAVYPI